MHVGVGLGQLPYDVSVGNFPRLWAVSAVDISLYLGNYHGLIHENSSHGCPVLPFYSLMPRPPPHPMTTTTTIV